MMPGKAVGGRRRPPPARRSGGCSRVLIAVGAALAYSIVGLGNDALTSGLNDLRVGVHRGELLPTRDADHGRDVRAMAGKDDLERALRSRGRGSRACPGGRHDVGE